MLRAALRLLRHETAGPERARRCQRVPRAREVSQCAMARLHARRDDAGATPAAMALAATWATRQRGETLATLSSIDYASAICRHAQLPLAAPPIGPPNTGDKLRASNMLNARLLHPLVRRPRRFLRTRFGCRCALDWPARSCEHAVPEVARSSCLKPTSIASGDAALRWRACAPNCGLSSDRFGTSPPRSLNQARAASRRASLEP